MKQKFDASSEKFESTSSDFGSTSEKIGASSFELESTSSDFESTLLNFGATLDKFESSSYQNDATSIKNRSLPDYGASSSIRELASLILRSAKELKTYFGQSNIPNRMAQILLASWRKEKAFGRGDAAGYRSIPKYAGA